ncbi:hypothetical protein QQ045_011280 [Rhodiola kirilowii]
MSGPILSNPTLGSWQANLEMGNQRGSLTKAKGKEKVKAKGRDWIEKFQGEEEGTRRAEIPSVLVTLDGSSVEVGFRPTDRYEAIKLDLSRGRGPQAVRSLGDVVRTHRPSLLGLIETKKEDGDLEALKCKLGFTDCLLVGSQGRSG